MKRTIFAFIALFSLVAGFAQLQNVLPLSVRIFMDERADRQRLLKYNPHEASLYKSQYARPMMINGVEMVDAFIDIESVSALPILRSHGVIINCEFDGFVTAQVPVELLPKITQLPGVSDVEISKVVELCTDSTLSATHAGQVLNGPDYGLPQAYDGSGIIIGVIDQGFDYRHLAFRCADDTSRTRIVRVYDEIDTTGHPAIIGKNQISGSVFMGEQLDTMTYDCYNAHGTHTASIAAGLHVGGYGGMAPGADIVLCSVRDMDLYITETRVINAMKYIYAYADSVGKPCVVSLSVNTYKGSHDGLDRISKAVAQLTGPGRIFVIAAGNSGSKNFYVHGPVTVEKPLRMLFAMNSSDVSTDGSYYYSDQWSDVWLRDKGVRLLCKYHILDKYTKRIAWESELISIYRKIDSSEISDFFEPDEEKDSEGYISALISQVSSSKYELQCKIYNLKSKSYTIDASGRYNSRYQIGITLYPPSLKYPTQPDSIYIDSWLCVGQYGNVSGPVYIDEISEDGDTISTQAVYNFYRNSSSYSSINTYAVHDSVISAGGYVARNNFYSLNWNNLVTQDIAVGSVYMKSSFQYPGYGPTGQHLPTISAPSYLVTAAASRYSYFTSWMHGDLVMRTEDGYTWGQMSGTSMAAPTVAGIIAQWLQIEPTLTPGDIKYIFSKTAIKDSYTQDPNYGHRFGPYGKIDAMAGVQYLLSLHEDDILPGDINGDGSITIKDVTCFINYLLSHDDSSIVALNSDLYPDGILSIRDVTILINMLLAGGS